MIEKSISNPKASIESMEVRSSFALEIGSSEMAAVTRGKALKDPWIYSNE
jgi:hypothetical protein